MRIFDKEPTLSVTLHLFWSMMCACVCVRICRTQAVIEKVQEHQHAAAHDHEHTDHDWGDVHRLLVLLLRAVIPLVLHVASAGGENTFKGDCRPEVAFWMLRTLKD